MQVFTKQNPYTEAWLAANHGKFDNIWTAEYETRLAAGRRAGPERPVKRADPQLRPRRAHEQRHAARQQPERVPDRHEPDQQHERHRHLERRRASQASAFPYHRRRHDLDLGRCFRHGVQAACCDPGVAYGPDGSVYAIILDTSPAVTYIIKSTDGGATWRAPTSVSTPDRPNVAVDPSNANIVYITFTDFNQPAGRIAGYKSTDGGVTWGSEFLIGDPISAARLPAIEPAARSLQRLDLRRLPGV